MGTGLGLSISRRLVQLLGGEIAVTSRKGAGSSFWFDIPLTVVDADAAVLEQALLSRDRHGVPTAKEIRLKGRVLIAEDNPANQMIAQSMLTRLGLSVDVAANGLEALDAVRNRPYDLVLMDIGMPEMDGIKATRKIRGMGEPTASIPVIAVTAHVMRGERESLRVQGLDDYLAKPIDRAAMVDCLRRWLRQEEDKMAVADQLETPDRPQASTSVIDRAILDRLLDDVGPENAKAVIDAFLQELERQTAVLEGAADSADLDAMSQAAHRLKSSAASFGAGRLSRLTESIEQAAKAGNSATALDHMGEFRSLSKASLEAMDRFRDEIFGPDS
jgi:CheY-like chemotaxis protein